MCQASRPDSVVAICADERTQPMFISVSDQIVSALAQRKLQIGDSVWVSNFTWRMSHREIAITEFGDVSSWIWTKQLVHQAEANMITRVDLADWKRGNGLFYFSF